MSRHVFIFSATETVDGIEWTYSVSNGETTIRGRRILSPAISSSTFGSIKIPSTLGGFPVSSIGKDAFSGCNSLTSVTIPSSVVSIGDFAFSGCTGLTSVVIPSSVTLIGRGAFSGCSKLKIVVDEGNPNYTSQGGTLFDKKMTALIRGPGSTASYIIPSGVNSIGYDAFDGCSDLTSVRIPSSVTSIGDCAFSYCSGLTSVEIPSSVVSIGNAVFHACLSLKIVVSGDNPNYTSQDGVLFNKEMTTLICCPGGVVLYKIPSNVTLIWYAAFSGCKSLTSIEIPSCVTSIGANAFAGCSSLTSVVIPSSVTSIGEGAFYGCSGLTSVTISEGVTSIGDGAFRYCTGLTSVTIPKSVTSIEDYAFDYCSGLTSLEFLGAPPFVEEGTFYDLKVIATYLPEYALQWRAVISNGMWNGLKMEMVEKKIVEIIVDREEATDASCFKYKISNGIVTITGLRNGYPAEIVIPSIIEGCPVTLIGEKAFVASKSLTSVVIPSSVTSIGTHAFSYCSDLKIVVTEGNLNYTSQDGALFNKKMTRLIRSPAGMASYTIPSSVTSIGKGAFSGCKSLTSVTIPSSVVSIGDFAFFGCKGLTSVIIPEGVTSIGSSAFEGCISLTSVTIPSSVTSIGGGAFSGCSGLTSVTIPEGVTSIGEWAFSGCTGLTSVAIPSSVTSIGSSAFSDCSGLTSVTIPEGVTSIGYSAFCRCDGLISVTFLGVPPMVDDFDPPFPVTNGYYLEEYASEWEAVINANGKWWNLTMQMIEDDDGVVDKSFFIYTINEGKATIVAIQGGSPVEIAIPSTLEGCPVTSIGFASFSLCSKLTSVEIPSSVTSIEDCAFRYCSKLTSVTFLGKPPSVGVSVFPETNGYYLEEYASEWEAVLDANGKLQDLTMQMAEDDDGVADESFLIYTIRGGKVTITGLQEDYPEEIAIPSTIEGYPVTSIKERAFEYSSHLTSILIPEGVISIGDCVFGCCLDLTSVTIPSSVTSIGENAFYGCLGLKIVVDEGNPNYTSQDGALFDKEMATLICGPGATTSYIIPSSVTSIGYVAFLYRSALTSVVIPKSVTYVGNSAFYGCDSLKSVTFFGVPPMVNDYDPPFSVMDGCDLITGYYLEEYASEWEAVISNGKWNGLTMQMSTVPSFEVVLSAVGNGTVSGDGEYAEGESVKVTAVADEGWVFCGWNIEPAVMTPEYTFKMPDKAVKLTAYFAPAAAVSQAIKHHLTEHDRE